MSGPSGDPAEAIVQSEEGQRPSSGPWEGSDNSSSHTSPAYEGDPVLNETSPANATPEEESPRPEVLQVSQDGRLPPGARVTGVGWVRPVWEEAAWTYDLNGSVTGAAIVLTWNATSPGTEELRLRAGPVEKSGPYIKFVEGSVVVQGPAPLAINLTDLTWRKGLIAVAAFYPDGDVPSAALEQPLRIEGRITYVPGT